MRGKESRKDPDGSCHENRRRSAEQTPLDAVSVDDASSIPMNRLKGSKKPPDDLNRGSNSPSPRRSCHDKSLDRHRGKDSPPHQSRRRKQGYSPKRHHRNFCVGPFTTKILEYPIPRFFANPPNSKTYDGTTNPDEHMEHIDTVLDYHQAQGAVKCKLFVLTLKGTAISWFKGLEDNLINSWKELCDEFTSHFSARRK